MSRCTTVDGDHLLRYDLIAARHNVGVLKKFLADLLEGLAIIFALHLVFGFGNTGATANPRVLKF